MSNLYRKLYGTILGVVLGLIVGGMVTAIVLDIRQWDSWGMGASFIILQILWAIIFGITGWVFSDKITGGGL